MSLVTLGYGLAGMPTQSAADGVVAGVRRYAFQPLGSQMVLGFLGRPSEDRQNPAVHAPWAFLIRARTLVWI